MRQRGDTTSEFDTIVAVSSAVESLETSLEAVQTLEKLVKDPNTKDQAIATFVNEGGFERCSLLLHSDSLDFDDGVLLSCLVSLLSVLARAVPGSFLVSGLVEGLSRLIVECSDDAAVRGAARVVSMLSEDAALLETLVQQDVLSVLLSRPVGLVPVLPRLLRDPRLAAQFVTQGGVAELARVIVFEQNTQHQLASCVAVVELLSKDRDSLLAMIEEEGFVAGVVSLLNNEVNVKTRIHVVKSLLKIALEPQGAELVETGAVVPLLESLMTGLDQTADPDAVALSMLSLELMALLCNSKSALDQADELGGEEFVEYLLSFLDQPKLLTPLCSLFHVLCFGAHKDLVVDGLQKALAEQPSCESIRVTLELIGIKVQVATPSPPALPPRRPKSAADTKKARMNRKRLDTMKEVQSSERTYSLALFTVVKVYMPILKPVLSASEFKTLFCNVEELYELHKGFLKKVDKEMKKESPELSPLLLELSSSMLDVYAIYVRGNNHAVDLLTSKMRSKKIRQLIQDGTKSVSGNALSLENYVRLPLQRGPRYVALALEIDLATPTDDSRKLSTSLAASSLQDTWTAALQQSKRNFSSSASALPSLPSPRANKQTPLVVSKPSALSSSVGFIPRKLLGKEPVEMIRLTKHRPVSMDVPSLQKANDEVLSAQAPPSTPKSPREEGILKSPREEGILKSPREEGTASVISSRVSSAYGVSEKLRIAKGTDHPFDVLRGRELMGHGYTKQGQFFFQDLEGSEVLVLPMEDLAKAKKKSSEK